MRKTWDGTRRHGCRKSGSDFGQPDSGNKSAHPWPISSPAAVADPQVGPVFASFDDVTLRLTPLSWITWDMAVLDAKPLVGDWAKRRDIRCCWIKPALLLPQKSPPKQDGVPRDGG